MMILDDLGSGGPMEDEKKSLSQKRLNRNWPGGNARESESPGKNNSGIRRKPLSDLSGGDYDINAYTPEIVDANEYRPFWAQVLNGLVRFGTGNIIGQNVVLQWQDSNPMIPDSIGFMTGWGSTGDWNIQG